MLQISPKITTVEEFLEWKPNRGYPFTAEQIFAAGRSLK